MVPAALSDKNTLCAIRRTGCHQVPLKVPLGWWLFSGLARPDEGLKTAQELVGLLKWWAVLLVMGTQQ